MLRKSLPVAGGPPAGILKDLEGRFGTGMLSEWLKATFLCGVALTVGCSSKPAKSCKCITLSVLREVAAVLMILWFRHSSPDDPLLAAEGIEVEVHCMLPT